MSIHKFYTLLKEAGLIMNTEEAEGNEVVSLSNADVELIFSKALNHESVSGSRELNFDQFFFALELVGIKVFNFAPNGTDLLLNDFIFPLKEEPTEYSTDHPENNNTIPEEENEDSPCINNETIVQLMEILKDEEMIDLLELLHQTLVPFFHRFSEKGKMTIDGFNAFCEEFKIYPEILPERTVQGLFHALSDFYN